DLPFTYGPEVLAVDPLSPNILYAGGFASDGTVVYRSEDAGETWSPASPTGGTWVRSFSFTAFGSLIARGEGGGLWLTTDHAEKWTSLSDRLPGSNVTAVAAGPDGTLTAALSPFGLFSSTDDGASWSAITDPYQTLLGITTVAVDPTNPSIAFASAGGAGLFKTVDAGEAWHLLYGAGGSDFVAVAPSDARRVYSIPTSLYEAGLLISSDGGATWTPSASSVHPDHLVVDPANADVAYGSSVQDTLWKTTDGGTSWTEMPNSLPVYEADVAASRKGPGIQALAVDPTDPQTVLAALSWNVWRTVTPNQAWTPSSPVGVDAQEEPYEAMYDTEALAFDAAGIAYSGTSGGVFLSADGGVTWGDERVGGAGAFDPQAADLDVRSIAVTKAGDTMYVGTPDGVAEATLGSSFNGMWFYARWAPPAPGLEGLSVRSLALSSDGTTLYAGTGRGVYVLRTTGG
ncbi:MAG: hypothetical protein ABR600_08270, partial [Actinomycetota bacterium]